MERLERGPIEQVEAELIARVGFWRLSHVLEQSRRVRATLSSDASSSKATSRLIMKTDHIAYQIRLQAYESEP